MNTHQKLRNGYEMDHDGIIREGWKGALITYPLLLALTALMRRHEFSFHLYLWATHPFSPHLAAGIPSSTTSSV